MNTYSLEQISKTGNLDSDLILRHYKLDLMNKFIEIKSNNPKLTQKGIAKQIGYSDSTLSKYRKDVNMKSPYKSTRPRKNFTSCRNTSKYVTNCQQVTSQNVTDRQNTSKYLTERHKNKSKLKGGDPNNINMSGRQLIEQVFQNNIND